MMGEYNRSLIRTLLNPTLPTFMTVLIKGLQTEDGFTSDSGLKKEILSGKFHLIKLSIVYIYYCDLGVIVFGLVMKREHLLIK